jgi:hypothetical protein
MGAVFAYVNLSQSSQLIAEEQINNLGNWSAAVTYDFPDVIFYSDSYWIALISNQNTAPPTIQEVVQTGDWSALTVVDGTWPPAVGGDAVAAFNLAYLALNTAWAGTVSLAQEQNYRVVNDGTLNNNVSQTLTIAQLALSFTGTDAYELAQEQEYRVINDGTLSTNVSQTLTIAQLALSFTGTDAYELAQEQNYRAVNDGTLTPFSSFQQEQTYRVTSDGTLNNNVAQTLGIAERALFYTGTTYTDVAQALITSNLAFSYTGTSAADSSQALITAELALAHTGTLSFELQQEQNYRVVNDGTLNTNVAQTLTIAQLALSFTGTDAYELAQEQTYRVINDGTLNTNVSNLTSYLDQEQTYRVINDGTLNVNVAQAQVIAALAFTAGGTIPLLPCDVITSNLVLSGTHYAVLANTAGGNINVILPSASGIAGRTHVVKKISAANTLSMIPNGTLDGDSVLTITDNNVSITVVSSGANWFII